MAKRPPQIKTNTERFTAWVGSQESVVVHTVVFAFALVSGFLHFAPWDLVLLILTTAVSLEAIYLAIFIQMSVNKNTESLREVEEDVEEIQEDIEDINEDIEEIEKDVGEIAEDVEEMTEEEAEEEAREKRHDVTLEAITTNLQQLLADVENLKKGR